MEFLLTIYRVKDKNGTTALDLLRPDDEDIRALVRKANAHSTLSSADIADGRCGSSGVKHVLITFILTKTPTMVIMALVRARNELMEEMIEISNFTVIAVAD